MNCVNYCLTGDKNYLDQLLVVMTSIVLNQHNDRPAHFYLFVKNLSYEDEVYLNKIHSVGMCDLTIIDATPFEQYFQQVDVSKFKNSYINIVCYYRLLMLKFLPDSVKKCFYVDGDMIITDDLTWIWDEMAPSDILSAVVEIHAMEHRESILAHLNQWPEFSKFIEDPDKYPYFNAGFFLLNVELAKKLQLWEEALKFLTQHQNPPYADQDILNAIIGQNYTSRVKFLPPYYNVFCAMDIDYEKQYTRGYYDPKEISDSFKFAKILHYAGGLKPWNYANCHYYNEWWDYASKSPAAGSLLLKSQEVHRNLCKELFFTKKEYQDILQKNKDNEKKSSFKLNFEKYLNEVDPIILRRYQTYASRNNPSFIKKILTLKKYHKEAKKNINSDHELNYKAIKQKINKFQYISFDIFDTLLCRPFANPTDVFRYIEKKTNRTGFKNKRVNSESKARVKYNQQEEVTIDQIYEFMEEYYDLKNMEIETEIVIQKKNPTVSVLFDYAKTLGKQIILTSDMYLPKKTIELILKNCGYEGYVKLYLSSDCLRTKRTGTLFQKIFSDFNIDPSAILHIGDNLHSDFKIPIKLGMSAIRITKNIDALLESNCRANEYYRRDSSLEASLLLATLSTFRCEKYDYWTNFGVYYAGIVVSGYAQWLFKKIKNDDIHTIFFVARDGYTLKKALSLISGDLFDCHYVYAPRRISTLCNMNLESKLNTDMLEAESAVETLLSYYQNFYKTDLVLSDLQDKLKFIRNHEKELINIADSKRSQYRHYLEKISNSKNIALIDTISIHFSSQILISETLNDRDIKGYYWTIVETSTNKDKIQRNPHSCYQINNGFAIKDWDIMEFFITSPEAPISDISADGKPVYKNCTKYDLERSKTYPNLSKGELIFVKRFAEMTKDLDLQIPAESINTYLDVLLDMPTKVDRKKIATIKHPYDSENSKFVPIFKTWFK